MQLRILSGNAVLEEKRLPRAGAQPTLDSNERLRVGVAVGTRDDDKERVDRLVKEADLDVVILDSSQGRLISKSSLWQYDNDCIDSKAQLSLPIVVSMKSYWSTETHLSELDSQEAHPITPAWSFRGRWL